MNYLRVGQNYKQVSKLLSRLGWEPDRQNGRHVIWKSPAGMTFSLPNEREKIPLGILQRLDNVLRESKEGRVMKLDHELRGKR